MVEEGEVTLFVDLDHVRLYDGTLADGIKRDFYRLEPFLRRAVRKLVEGIDESFVKTDAGTPREFFVSVFNADTVVPMRSLKADAIGKLSCFRGTVTRTSEVRPELFMGTFKCLVCQTGASLTPTTQCLTHAHGRGAHWPGLACAHALARA